MPDLRTAGVTDHGAQGGLTDDDHIAYLRIETSRSGTQPAAVGTTPGTAATAFQTWTGGTGGNTTIVTTGVGGIGGGLAITLGTGGTAAAADTASTGGKGGGAVWTMGTGGAATAAGTNTGGAGGDWEVIGGTGGAASGGTGNTGGVGGSLYLVGGAAGSGGSPAAGNVVLGRTSGGTERGQVLIPAGTAALPSLSFASDPNTGFRSNGADELGISVGGASYGYIGATFFYVNPPATATPNVTSIISIVPPNHTGISSETPFFATGISGATYTLASAATIALYRVNVMGALTFNGVAGGGTETVTTAVTLEVGLPVQGSNLTMTNAPVALRALGSVLVGDSALPPANGPTNIFIVQSGTAPSSSPADTVTFYSSDDAAGHTVPSFYCEGTNVVATAQADSASSVRVKMRINGTVYTFLCI